MSTAIENILLFNPETVNLLTKKYVEEYREQFEAYKSKVKDFTTQGPAGVNAGDIILFLNGYDVPMISEVLGFNEGGKAFLLWDCYWFPVDLNDRMIEVIN